jgi:hypothetical protein
VCEAFRTYDVNYILIRRKGVGIHEAPADKEDEYFPGADCDPRRQGTRRYMCRFLIAFGAMVTIGLGSSHHVFLFSSLQLVSIDDTLFGDLMLAELYSEYNVPPLVFWRRAYRFTERLLFLDHGLLTDIALYNIIVFCH